MSAAAVFDHTSDEGRNPTLCRVAGDRDEVGPVGSLQGAAPVEGVKKPSSIADFQNVANSLESLTNPMARYAKLLVLAGKARERGLEVTVETTRKGILLRFKKNPKVIILEGLIGAGKSTLLRILGEEFGAENKVVVVQEPVDVWIETGALDRFYSNPQTEAFEFQMFAWATRAMTLRKAWDANPDADIFIIERSPFSDRYVFFEGNRRQGRIRPDQVTKYEMWWDSWRLIWPHEPTHFIFVNPPVPECMKRLKSRGRGEEVSVGSDYQEVLANQHREMFQKYCQYPLLTVDEEVDYREPGPARSAVVQKIRQFINS